MVSTSIKRAVLGAVKRSPESNREIASQIGIDPAQFTRYLKGRGNVSVTLQDRLADWAGVKVVDLGDN